MALSDSHVDESGQGSWNHLEEVENILSTDEPVVGGRVVGKVDSEQVYYMLTEKWRMNLAG